MQLTIYVLGSCVVLGSKPSSQFRIIVTLHCEGLQSLLFYHGATDPSGSGPPHYRDFMITHNDAPQSVGLVWTSDQPIAETST
jgi:hypothetical protein